MNTFDPHQPGVKLDAMKPPLYRGVIAYFPLALSMVARVSDYGAHKYQWGGWKTVPNGLMRYTDAMVRHLVDEDKETLDQESALAHAAHVAWNALARLELMLQHEREAAEMMNILSPGERNGRD